MVSERPLLLTPPWLFSTTLLYILEFVPVPTLRQILTPAARKNSINYEVIKQVLTWPNIRRMQLTYLYKVLYGVLLENIRAQKRRL